jgi:hypothetical protein
MQLPFALWQQVGFHSLGVSGCGGRLYGQGIQCPVVRQCRYGVRDQAPLSPWIASLVIVPCITGLYGNAAILEAAMPSQLLSFIIAGKFKLDEQTLAFVIMVDTILAFVTLPLIQRMLPVVG